MSRAPRRSPPLPAFRDDHLEIDSRCVGRRAKGNHDHGTYHHAKQRALSRATEAFNGPHRALRLDAPCIQQAIGRRSRGSWWPARSLAHSSGQRSLSCSVLTGHGSAFSTRSKPQFHAGAVSSRLVIAPENAFETEAGDSRCHIHSAAAAQAKDEKIGPAS